jgi:hypothetical protein
MRCAECSSKRVNLGRRRRRGMDANQPRLARAPQAVPSCASQRSHRVAQPGMINDTIVAEMDARWTPFAMRPVLFARTLPNTVSRDCRVHASIGSSNRRILAMNSSSLTKPRGTGFQEAESMHLCFMVSVTVFLVCTYPWISTKTTSKCPEKCNSSKRRQRM